MDVFLIVLALQYLNIAASVPLEEYNVDPDTVTVSGFSSGSTMAIQLHVAYSSLFKGVGGNGAVAYYCAEADADQSLACMRYEGPGGDHLAAETIKFQDEGKVDHTSNMAGSRVFIFNGAQDNLVDAGNLVDIEQYYLNFVEPENVYTFVMEDLCHGWPSEDYGTACSFPNTDVYINRCDYHGANETLQYFYGDLQKPNSNTPTPGDFYSYDQTEFGTGNSWDDEGYIYVPTGCMNKQQECRLHVHLHGCALDRMFVEDRYARNTFFDHVGEMNDIIILYPQLGNSVGNLNGCWDWWGHHDPVVSGAGNYANQLGPQMSAIHDMVQRVIGNNARNY